MAELADAHGSGPCENTHGGSSPLIRTTTVVLAAFEICKGNRIFNFDDFPISDYIFR